MQGHVSAGSLQGCEVVTLSPRVQTLVDQLVQELGLQALRPSSLNVNMDPDGIVQDVKPLLVYRRGNKKAVDSAKKPV